MKKFLVISFLFLTLAGGWRFAQKYVRIQLIPKAHSQAGTKDQKKPLPEKPAAPTDMPIPKEMLNDLPPAAVSPSPAQLPSAPAPQIAPIPPPPLLNEELPPMEQMAEGKSPQELDPSIKFLSNDGFVYDPTGRRDPFKSYMVATRLEAAPLEAARVASKPLIPSFLLGPSDQGQADSLEGHDVVAFKLIGILWDVHDPKAMVRSPSNKVYLVRRKTRIGRNNGYVAAIREGEIVVVELTNDAKTSTTRVLTLQK